ncbi:MAG: carbohydrate ABC transporter permease [Chloroflexi bacterium]|jgi:multiple sugar transport system permease protein|uniref:Maltose ABC transporter permease n=1 Tax=Candidatus Thermofonsia Clade 3 bacterium TaxID=2364212 RepID=A0A2M8QAF4_9CHLR|nr:carbohydrate ABC transporter permease [Candidatus Roseilinea sp. NK_OTU-006]PJF46778.1 MAG: maltose ABC transporter permease [Candidatus Thermofonsia Clade 3 bacterium]RMG62370.1 MAG: carbohydrate ABC transporter permease [Chloroflexota bacterium]
MRHSSRRRWSSALLDVLVWLILVIMLVPALWLVFTSVRNPVEVNAKPPVWIPRELTLDGFKPLFGQATEMTGVIPFDRYFLNSTVVALVSTVIAVALGTMAGYVFARYRFRGKNIVFLGIMLSRAVPGIALSLPLFLLFARISQAGPLKLIDTQLGLIIVYVAVNVPFTVWLMDGFFREIPAELSEAAQLDGCSEWQTFTLINLPLALPGLAASAIFAFLAAWNEFQIASVLTRTVNSKTAPVGLFDFTGQFTIDWRGMAAMATVMMIPAIAFVFVVQRNLVRGLTFGAVK